MSAEIIINGALATKTAPDWQSREVVCLDGFKMPVQASHFHYCQPRDDHGPWISVEVGYPSERPEPWAEWKEYAGDVDRPTDTVYGHVPVLAVARLIELHGGRAS